MKVRSKEVVKLSAFIFCCLIIPVLVLVIWIGPVYISHITYPSWHFDLLNSPFGFMYNLEDYTFSSNNLWSVFLVETFQDMVLVIPIFIGYAFLTKVFYKANMKIVVMVLFGIYITIFAYSFKEEIPYIKDLTSLDSYPNQINKKFSYYNYRITSDGFFRVEVEFETADSIDKVFEYYSNANFPSTRTNSDLNSKFRISNSESNYKFISYGNDRSYLYAVMERSKDDPTTKVVLGKKSTPWGN